MSETAHNRLDRLISEFDRAMLVTTSLNGQLRARPMAIARHSRGAVLTFATRAQDEKLEEVLKQPKVAVTMQDTRRFLSISGRASIETDLQIIEDAWSPAMKIWFPEGPKDPDLTLIRIKPDCAEYWDRAGLRQLEFLWEAGKALVRGKRVDDSTLGGHAKIKPN